MQNISDNSDLLTSNEDSSLKDIKTILLSYNEVIFTIVKLANELETIKLAQNSVNDKHKSEEKNLESDIEQLKSQLIDYQTTLANQNSKISYLEKEISVFKIPNLSSNDIKIDNELNKLPPLNKMEDNVNFLVCMKLFENAITNSKDIRQIKESFDIFRNDALSIFNFKDQMIDNLTRENQKLEQVNTMLKNKIVVFEEENNKKKFCVHCHEMFTQKFNEEKSCTYHPGKLKYYSCRGCGADEYFTCCMKCSKCLKGCKIGKHIGGV